MFYNRKNIRLSDYDYSQAGGYYITICTQGRKCVLSRILEHGESERPTIECLRLGEFVEAALLRVAEQYGVIIDSYVIMPNHVHAIIFIQGNASKPISVGSFVGAVKSISANQWIRECKAKGQFAGKLWQRNYFEHILRNELDYLEKRKYVDENPDKWQMDEEYSEM